MYIKSMVIDGFKSYGQRTEINGFDNMFNAITGLNGSGKSNILDAICFLLGITNLSHVRASNLQELVYKNGQAGITKATVSITFDNRDKKQSPFGYEQFDEVTIARQVVVGGKNKYLINGTNVQNNRVQDFFRSVQLNVNNPHFLIMQGRITKVLNMKPPEILAMIEEAVGTRMYESKKQQAHKTIERKDAKLREINNILQEEINPTLSKLKEERSTYLEFQKIQRELDHLTKLYVAYKFLTAEETCEKAKEDLLEVHKKLDDLQQAINDGVKEIKAIEVKIGELERQRDEELGGRLEELENELKEKEKESLKVESTLKSTKDSKKQEERKRTQIEKGKQTDENALGEKEKLCSGLQSMFDQLRAEDEAASEALRAAQKRFEAISLGQFEGEDGKAATLQEQLIATKSDISAAQTEIKTADMKLKHNNAELKKLRTEMKKTENEYKRDSANLDKYEQDVKRAENEMSNLQYEDGRLEQLEDRARSLKHEVNAAKSHVESLGARVPWLNFQYSDPERGFDRSQVKGVAATLFSVPDRKFCQALDTASSGKLSNVVVTSAAAGGKILKHGNLARRTNLIPLDKIRPNVISPQVLKKAQGIVGQNRVWRAIDLVEYDNSNAKAMEYIFGGVLICTDIGTANQLAYHPDVNRVCVTLDGDKANPGGELSGGAVSKSGSILAQIMSVTEAKQEFQSKSAELHTIQAECKQIAQVAQRFNKLKQEYELKVHELQLIRQRLEQTAHHRLVEEVRTLEEQCQSIEAGVSKARTTEAEGSKKVKDLEYKIKNAKQLKEKELNEAQVEVKKAKKAEEDSKAKWSTKEAEEASLKMEIVQLKESIAEAEEQLRVTDEAVKGYLKEVESLNEQVTEHRVMVNDAKAAVKAQKEALSSQNREINSEHGKAEKIKKANGERELEIQQLKHTITKASDDAKGAEKTVNQMLAKYEWIADDRQFFGQPNTAYDFNTQDPKEAGRRIQKLEETKDKLEKTVNMRAMNMLGKAEEQYNDLMRKKKTVEQDKAKIIKVIEELDLKKKQELHTAWEKVNKDFGSIFSSLLPGTKAKLQPPEGQDVLDGLEVKVAFGDVWKESLNELSGGQRSLVALSLILSLLLFRPAPLYILDEVDAALDLSHTQNIGHMLKTHFKSSQFIVVSLKDGMFNNANVLFRTKFVDGMSTVSRSVQQTNRK